MLDDAFKPFLAGFDLAATRREDGKLYPIDGTSEPLDDWPKEIAACGNVYCLEHVVKGNNGYESGQYA